MLETIGKLLASLAPFITAVLGLVAIFFLWVAVREWRSGARAAFGIERDIAKSEMIGAISRAGIVLFVGLIVMGLGQLGDQVEKSTGDAEATPVRTPLSTRSVFDATPQPGEPVLTLLPTGTPQPAVTDIPPLPSEPTQPPVVEPTPQTARVTVFGGVWLRDAPNGGTIEVLPQDSIVQMLEGSEFAGTYEWQKIKVLNTPPGSQGLVGLEGWVASQFLEGGP